MRIKVMCGHLLYFSPLSLFISFNLYFASHRFFDRLLAYVLTQSFGGRETTLDFPISPFLPIDTIFVHNPITFGRCFIWFNSSSCLAALGREYLPAKYGWNIKILILFSRMIFWRAEWAKLLQHLKINKMWIDRFICFISMDFTQKATTRFINLNHY